MLNQGCLFSAWSSLFFLAFVSNGGIAQLSLSFLAGLPLGPRFLCPAYLQVRGPLLPSFLPVEQVLFRFALRVPALSHVPHNAFFRLAQRERRPTLGVVHFQERARGSQTLSDASVKDQLPRDKDE